MTAKGAGNTLIKERSPSSDADVILGKKITIVLLKATIGYCLDHCNCIPTQVVSLL